MEQRHDHSVAGKEKAAIDTPHEGENRSCCRDWPGAGSEGEQLSKTGSHTARCFLIGKKERDQSKLNQYKWLRCEKKSSFRPFPYTPGTENRYRFQRLENGLRKNQKHLAEGGMKSCLTGVSARTVRWSRGNTVEDWVISFMENETLFFAFSRHRVSR